MRESELLEHIRLRSVGIAGTGRVRVGPGDDCAVLDLSGGEVLVTVDHVVAGRHVDLATTSIDLVARKAIGRSVSDIAASGGTPLASLATACFPPGYQGSRELFDRMAYWAGSMGCPLVGGDVATSPGPLVLTVTVLGHAHAIRGPVLRSGALPGDALYVTGALGGSLASGRHLTFAPRDKEGRWLCDALGPRLHAMIDVSDGLGRDAARLAAASSVRVEIDAGALPLHQGVAEWREGVSGGEDYELCFAVAPDAVLPAACPVTGVALTRIGRIFAGAGCVVRTAAPGEAGGPGAPGAPGEVVDVGDLGWDHHA